jgi:hypothetical protein
MTVTASVMAPPTWMSTTLFRATVGLLTSQEESGATSVLTKQQWMLARIPLTMTAVTTCPSLMLLAPLQILTVTSVIMCMTIDCAVYYSL